jgi:hypothetical protein
MEWSSDGYVLAVGWEQGWAIFSVGGRCLAAGFGVDDAVDEEKYVFPPCISKANQTLIDFKIYSCMEWPIWQVVKHLPVALNLTLGMKFWAPGNFELVVLSHHAHTSMFPSSAVS